MIPLCSNGETPCYTVVACHCYHLHLCSQHLLNTGAYRRWKEVEINGASSTGTDTKKKNGLGGKGKKKPKNAADKFYDALKKFGSGPAEKVRVTNTG